MLYAFIICDFIYIISSITIDANSVPESAIRAISSQSVDMA